MHWRLRGDGKLKSASGAFIKSRTGAFAFNRPGVPMPAVGTDTVRSPDYRFKELAARGFVGELLS